MKIALVQTCTPATPEAARDHVLPLVREAAARGAELVLLPEKWANLGSPEDTAKGAEPFDGPALQWAAQTAPPQRGWATPVLKPGPTAIRWS